MFKRRGFTLIELLVVIAIIALLMAILMPSLRRVKEQAKTIVCQTMLKQWGLHFSMYSSDHNNKFSGGWHSQIKDGKDFWLWVLEPLYRDDPKILSCPSATQNNESAFEGTRNKAWGPCGILDTNGDVINQVLGSFGINDWVSDSPDKSWVPHYNWRHSNVRGASEIPLLSDCIFPSGHPQRVDQPPDFPGQRDGSNDLRDWCIDRHDAYINVLFVDFNTVRKVGLKELWTLKWHRGFDLDAPRPILWDAQDHWMHKYKDYEE